MMMKVIERISSVSGWVSGIGVIVMAVVVTVDIVLRYFFSKPLLFADEVGVYCMIFVAFVGAALTLKMRRHIMVDLLYRRLPRKIQLWLDVITTILGTLVICIITWESADWVHYTYKSGFMSPGVLETPMWIPMSLVPLGLFFWSAQYIVESIKVVTLLRSQRPKAKEEDLND